MQVVILLRTRCTMDGETADGQNDQLSERRLNVMFYDFLMYSGFSVEKPSYLLKIFFSLFHSV